MFCTNCGAKLADGAKFCTACGTKVERVEPTSDDLSADEGQSSDTNEGTQAVEPAEENTETEDKPEAATPEDTASSSVAEGVSEVSETFPEPKRSLSSALIEFRRTTLKAVPTFVIVIVALLLATGTAYALYRVAVDIVIPMVEEWAESNDEATQEDETEDTAETDGESVASEGEDEITQASGNPQSILQLGEILTMSPEEIPAYLGSQGLELRTYHSGDSWDDTMGESVEIPSYCLQAGDYSLQDMSMWSLPSVNDVTHLLGDNLVDPTLEDELSQKTLGPSIALGSNLIESMHYSQGGDFYTEADLGDGMVPNSICLMGLPLAWLDEATANELAELCGFGHVSQIYTYGISTTSSEALIATEQVITGFFEGDGNTYVWLVNQTRYPDEETGEITLFDSEIMCFPIEVARQWVADDDLYTAEEWNAATNSQRALMVAQVFIEDRSEGNGGERINLRTGEIETYEILDGGNYRWLNEDEYREQIGDDWHSYYMDMVHEPTFLSGTIIDATTVE